MTTEQISIHFQHTEITHKVHPRCGLRHIPDESITDVFDDVTCINCRKLAMHTKAMAGTHWVPGNRINAF